MNHVIAPLEATPEFADIVRKVRAELNPDENRWDLVFLPRTSNLLRQNDEERGKRYAGH